MADRRMMSKKITDTDAFLDMPLSSQALYFHFLQNADDEGFLGNPKTIVRKIGANQNDLDLLIMKRFIIAFDSGICVIKHWFIHNYIQKDRFNETTYIEEKEQLQLKENKSYTKCIQNGYNLDTQYSIDKVSIDKDNKDNGAVEVLEYLNLKAKKKYKPIESNMKFIKARLKDYTVDDLKRVIDLKVKEWQGTNMAQYLRCETLFNATKFESYINSNNSSNQPAKKGLFEEL